MTDEGWVRRIIEADLRRRRLHFVAVDDLAYDLHLSDGTTRTIGVENVIRNVQRSQAAEEVRSFLDRALGPLNDLPMAWEDAAPGIRWSAEATGVELGDAVVRTVSPRLMRALVHVSADEERVRYLRPADVAEWDVTESAAEATATRNLDALLDTLEVQVDNRAGADVMWFDVESPSKASLIFAATLRAKLGERLGWPVLAVAPARDFLLFFSNDAGDDFLDGLGSVVVREFTTSAYPVTDEVLEVADGGVRAVGRFA